METIVRKNIARILKYMALQQLGEDEVMLVLLLLFFFNMLLVSILVALSLLF